MRTAWIFPGQGAQYPGMGHDVHGAYGVARECFEEADEVLGRPLSRLIFEGSEAELTLTRNSQPAIFVVSVALMRVMQQLFGIAPVCTAGLSLGEYTALVASGRLGFAAALRLVQERARLMHEACEAHKGAMAVVLGLADEVVEQLVAECGMADQLWAANFNCPGQVVLSGTPAGIEAGTKAVLAHGAKRVMPLQVHGAFHSGLMREAQDRLAPAIAEAPWQESRIPTAMNATGALVADTPPIQQQLLQQVTSPVRWHKGITAIDAMGVDGFLEIGCGKTLAGMNKRIGPRAATYSFAALADLKPLEEVLRA